MKLYKYRAITSSDGDAFPRLSEILGKNEFWCASPAALNDPEEFIWECDYAPTVRTAALLVELFVKYRGHDSATAKMLASHAISEGRIEFIARPVIQSIIDQSREEIGVACFGTSADSLVMGQCYGGEGVGVCIEIQVPDELLGDQLHRVEYQAIKRLHLDELLQASLDGSNNREVYSMSLLSKGANWTAEQEVRFISKRQNIAVQISGSYISRLILGPCLDGATIERLRELVASLSYELPLVPSALNMQKQANTTK